MHMHNTIKKRSSDSERVRRVGPGSRGGHTSKKDGYPILRWIRFCFPHTLSFGFSFFFFFWGGREEQGKGGGL